MSSDVKVTVMEKRDWLAVWIGFIIIAVGAVAVITGAFDFNAAKFSTWGHGTSFFECLLYEFIV